METVEIIVYMGIAVLAGGLVLMFVANINPVDAYKSMHRTFFGDDRLSYQEVAKEDFAMQAYKVWEQCGFGIQERNNTVYVKGTGVMDRTELFATFKKLNFCTTVQSGAESCGSREDVVFSSVFALPTVIRISCDPLNRKLVLS